MLHFSPLYKPSLHNFICTSPSFCKMQVLQPNPVQRESLRRGDHVFSYRHGHPSHGIYDGEGKVILFISTPSEYTRLPQCEQCLDHPNHGVTKHCLTCFLSVSAGTSELHFFQYAAGMPLFLARTRGGTCTLAHSDPPDDVMHRALHLLQNTSVVSTYRSYFLNSPEDFAVYCKTGLVVVGGGLRSSDVAGALTAALGVVAASPLRGLLGFPGVAFLGIGTHCVARLAQDIGIRRDVIKDAIKVPVEHLLDGTIHRS